MRTNDKIEKYNSFIHSNLKEFVDVFLNKDIKNKLNNNNRCRCPFHLSHDNDFAYNKRFGYWKCFGKCNEVVGDSFSVVQKLYFPYNANDKESKTKSYKNTCKMIEDFIAGREVKPIVFQKEEQMNYTSDVKMETIFQLMSKKFIEKNSIFTPEYIKNNFRSWFKFAEIDRFNKETIKEMKIFETNENLPKEMYFLSKFYFYMMYDDKNRLVGFQGRRKDDINITEGEIEIPKMYNLRGFDKSKMIYNLNNCIKNNANSLIILEGPGDVSRIYELFNTHCCVSLMGGELSPYQIYLLKKYFKPDTKITVMLDNDAAGRKYAKKVMKKLLLAGFKNVNYAHVFTVKDAGALKGESGKTEFGVVYNYSIEVALDQDNNLVYEYRTDKKGKSTFAYLLDYFKNIKKFIENEVYKK